MSNRLTFSLASLIVLIALGFVFGTASVMAHTTDPVTDHQHPVITIAEPTDVDDRVDGIQAADSDAGIDDHQVVYTVTFPDTPLDTEVETADFNATLRTADFLAAPTGMSATVGTPVVDSDNDKMYTVPVTVVFLDVSDPATDLNEIVLNFSYNADAFVSKKVIPHPTTGQNNEKTDAMAVTVLRIAPDRTAPVLTATVGAADPTTGAITVTLAFDETFTTAPRVTDLTAATSAIADTYEVGDVEGSGMSFTVKVTPDAATVESGDIPSGAVTLHVSGTDNDGNAIPARTTVNVRLAARPFTDTVAPEVVILPNPDRQSEAFAISFNATDNYSAATDLTVAVAITPATAVTEAAPTAMAQADGSYEVTVTPVAATEATPTISEQTITVMVTVTDAAKNSGSDREFFFLAERTYTPPPPPPDTTAPTLTVGLTATDATGAITVPLVFDEALQGVPTVTHAVDPPTLAGTYTVSAVADDGDPTTMNRYTVTVTPSALAVGDSDLPLGWVTLTVSAMDAAGNALAANTTVLVPLAARTAPADTVAPTFEHDAPTEPISGMTVVTLTFSEPVSGVGVTGAPSRDDAKYTVAVAGSGTAYTVTITPISRDNLAADMDLRLITFTVSGADAAGNAVDGSFSLSLAPRKVAPPPVTNAPPAFADSASIDNIVATVGMPIEGVFLPEATDPDGDSVFHWISPTLPRGLTFNYETRALTGTPSAAMSQTAYTYTASNSGGSDTIGFFITVNAAPVTPQPPANMPPAFADSASIDNIVATVGMPIEGVFLPKATDADLDEGEELEYTLDPDLPEGLNFDDEVLTLTGTPEESMDQTAYTYMVDDGNEGTATIGFFITVNPEPNVAPVYADSTPVAITGTVGVAITSVTVAATDANSGDTLTYSWDVDEADLGLTLNASTGTISGTPLKVHTGTHPVTATDSGGLTASRDVNVTISAPAPDPAAPVVTITTEAPTAAQMDSFAIAYTATDANAGDTVTVEVTHTVSPDGTMGYTVTHDAAAGMATIMQAAGSPIAVVTVTVTATDPGGLSGSGSIEVTFAAKAAIPEVVVPGAVTNLTATPGDGQVMLSWTAPADGGAVVSYAYSMNAGVSWTDIADSTAATTSYTVMNLTNGQTYSFIVRADNTAGPGGASNEISATPMAPALPAAPAGLTATAGDAQVVLKWTASTDATITGYEYSKDDGTTYVAISGSSATTAEYTVTGLTNGTAYKFRVRAVNSTGNGTDSSASATPMAPAVAPVTNYDEATGITTLAGTIPANGFFVIGAEDLPDLQRFYSEGGSISVLSSKTGAAAKDVVASEIMWGLNLRAIGAARTAHQFIELYNTTSAAIDLADVKLTFDGANTPPAAPTGMTLLDQVSNVSGVGWLISDAPGQSGRIAVPDDVATFVPADLISMYRKINYTRVVSTTLNKDDAADNRKKQLEGVPGGNALGSWAASDAADTYGVNLIGSPGEQHFVPYTVLTPTPVPRGTFIINEIGNHSNDAYDWVEIKRVGGGDNLKKWRLSQVTSDKKDTALVSFPDNDNHKIPNVGDVLLIVNSDPYQDPNHPLAAGTRINGNRAETTGVKSRYYVDGGLKLANSGKTLLIIRNSVDNGHLGKPNNVQDVLGTLSIVDNAAGLRTKLWPLVATGAPHGNVVKDTDDEDLRSGYVYTRNAGGGTGENHIVRAGYTGVGYKRSAAKNNQNGGTPGYDNGAVKVNDADLADSAMISISEIMYEKNRNEPQWIELYNSSMTQAINLSEWKLKLEHDRDVADSDIRTSVTTNNLGGGIIIQPNQTVLIVSNTTGRTSRASQGAVDFPATRVIDLWAQKDKLEVDAGKNRLTYRLLSQTAFKLTLMDKSGATVDVVGNLGAAPAWELPASENGEGRSSIIRRYAAGVPDDGTMAASWTFARDSQLTWVRFNETYYGSPDDIGTPGFKAGGPLPVSLSKFRPERLDDGSIRIAWVTESELNNAGFNILRSETKDGEFKQINTKLIAGKGTTSERTTYTYTDPSAKPNVVYYYQIQDVSIDGKVTTLRETRLKGHISAAGKLTTTWGELKALQ